MPYFWCSLPYKSLKICQQLHQKIKQVKKWFPNGKENKNISLFWKDEFTNKIIAISRITTIAAQNSVLINEINNKIIQMETIFEYRSSCAECTKQLNNYQLILSNIKSICDILLINLSAYDKNQCTKEYSICINLK
ncbi:MAG: hypothetical protein Ta2E_00250 [Mycoplasmoidaceae bacterium]|nr:MAG: hypothetical protein Ta2E_00250 [Mycoplasmoidaceae bacterium]